QYPLRPSDVRRLREEHLFYWIRPDLEHLLPKVLPRRQGASAAVQNLPGLRLRTFVNFEEDEHAGHHAPHHDHRPGMLAAHVWLLPANARTIAARLAEDRAQVEPANAGRYRANLNAFEERLGGLHGQLRQRLGKPARQAFLGLHA
ncbi:zinc ABC transporter substrate-binding protein, partial [Pseudomonas aeruginosa]|uniref:metal ABC transporter solute-binding protein, Zn/Mn family n=1 Tax=Pseudomonas aeruginosa TaxID=287 RepID=UPI0024B2712D